jgi:hypothetical protein
MTQGSKDANTPDFSSGMFSASILPVLSLVLTANDILLHTQPCTSASLRFVRNRFATVEDGPKYQLTGQLSFESSPWPSASTRVPNARIPRLDPQRSKYPQHHSVRTAFSRPISMLTLHSYAQLTSSMVHHICPISIGRSIDQVTSCAWRLRSSRSATWRNRRRRAKRRVQRISK